MQREWRQKGEEAAGGALALARSFQAATLTNTSKMAWVIEQGEGQANNFVWPFQENVCCKEETLRIIF